MERLAPRDIATLLDYLRELYATRSPDRLAAHLVDTLPRLVASDASSYNEIDVTAGATTLWISRPEVNSVVADGERIFDRHMAEHPVLRYLRMRSEPCVVRLSDTITPDAFHRLGIYEHFYRPARFDHLILCILSPLPAALRGLALCRDGRRDFGGQDLTMLEAVRPHIAQAFRNADVLVRLERHLGNLSLTSEGAISTRWWSHAMGSPFTPRHGHVRACGATSARECGCMIVSMAFPT